MKRIFYIGMLAFLVLPACMSSKGEEKMAARTSRPLDPEKLARATFAGGCFWCMEPPFQKLDGVIDVVSGYSGGHKANPTYEEVVGGRTGHLETVQILYDPSLVSFTELLEVFWRNIDPTDEYGQFVDRGPQYATAIFYHDEEQKRLAEQSRDQLQDSGRFERPIVTEIREFEEFFEAEGYHQDYYRTHKAPYERYRYGSGRDRFIKEAWKEEGKPDAEALGSRLTPLQYKVTQEDGTEAAFRNEYWDNKKEGIYVDIVSGEPLFSSLDKFDSGTGWPSFTRPLSDAAVMEYSDTRFFVRRTELKSRLAGSHLGHVFDDGPQPTGLRYCINSAALRFIPAADLEKEGYGRYQRNFQ